VPVRYRDKPALVAVVYEELGEFRPPPRLPTAGRSAPVRIYASGWSRDLLLARSRCRLSRLRRSLLEMRSIRRHVSRTQRPVALALDARWDREHGWVDRR
jgi:hypothetical protein